MAQTPEEKTTQTHQQQTEENFIDASRLMNWTRSNNITFRELWSVQHIYYGPVQHIHYGPVQNERNQTHGDQYILDDEKASNADTEPLPRSPISLNHSPIQTVDVSAV